MASKKKAKEVIRKKRAGNDAACEDRAAPKQMRAMKSKKKAASASVGGKDEAKRNLERTPKERTPKKIAKVRGSVAARKDGAGGTGESELDPFEVAKRRVKGSVPAIVDAMVERAKKGSCVHAKTLLEMTGARHMFDSEAEGQESGEPWAKLVLERLDEAESTAEAQSVSVQEELQEVTAAE